MRRSACAPIRRGGRVSYGAKRGAGYCAWCSAATTAASRKRARRQRRTTMPKIPPYIFKPLEEAARAMIAAALAYVILAITAGGFPTTQQGVTALLTGAGVAGLDAVRTGLNATPLTPPTTKP